MKIMLDYLRKKPFIYMKLKSIYGKTVGLYYFKELYLRKFGLFNGEKRLKLLTKECGDNTIAKEIASGRPFMLARYGSTEFRNLSYDNQFDLLCFYSGFFPNNPNLLDKFRNIYLESSRSIDFLVVWNYLNHLSKKQEIVKNLPNIKFILPDSSLMNDSKWIRELANKKVLIIHPFKKTIEQQYKIRNKLKILPKFKKLEVIQAVQTIAGNEDKRFRTWFDALNFMKREIDKKNFDIALIGCGAYGLPLAAYVKSKGKQAIHIGGGLQTFFGITGKRWENDKITKIDKYWVRPLKKDMPKNHNKVEGGCYW